MRLGLWGARMDNSGLGQQTLGFYNHMHPNKTVVFDISVLERVPGRVMRQFPERYKEEVGNTSEVKFIQGIPNHGDMVEFLTDLEVVFVAESAYNNDFYRLAKEMGVKVANQYNFEFFDWLAYDWMVVPDLFIAPSTWHYDEVSKFAETHGAKHVYLHCPVDRNLIPRRNVDTAVNFVHIAGRPAEHDRNGTYTFLEAVTLTEGNIKATVYTQDYDLANEIGREYPSVKVKTNISDYTEIYKKGSVLVLPRKYGGNCLPMNEALAAGMPVIMSKLSPQSDFLPNKWLVNAHETDIDFKPRVKIPVYECEPGDLAIKMLWFKSLSNKDMREQSDIADSLADQISWKTMEPKYREVLEALCLI